MIALWFGLALAQPPSVVAGEDLQAWRAIEQLRPHGEEEIAAYQDFLRHYPTSPLAEVVWGRLADLGALEDTWHAVPEIQDHADAIDASWQDHQTMLDRTPITVGVARLTSDGTPIAEPSERLRFAAHGGGGWSGQSPTGVVGIRGGSGPFSLVARFGAADKWFGQAGVHIEFPRGARPGGLFFESTMDTLGRLGAAGGAKWVVQPGLWIETSAGVIVAGPESGPLVLVEIARPF